MAKNIRSEYIKNLMEDKERLSQEMKEVAESTVQNILNETIKTNLKNILSESEDEDTFSEEDVVDDATQKTEDTTDVDATEEVPSSDDVTADSDVVTSDEESGEETKTPEDDVWSEVEQFKGEDGEYDLTGMDKDSLVKVLKVMGPEDGIRVVKKDDNTILLNDDETEKEYIIQLDDVSNDDESSDDEIEFDIDVDDSVEESKQNECNESDLGYTTNYQKQTAMTTPDNHEPADSSKTYSMDAGVPTGTDKPFPGNGDKAPFDKKVNEEECCDDEINETMTTQENGAYNRNTGMVHTNTNSKAAKGRNSHAGGEQIHGTSQNSYSEAQMEAIKRKANAIFNENKELKTLLPSIKQQLAEAIVINQSLANVIKIISENATTVNEKKDIIKRFTSVKTREESNNLLKTITEELKRSGKSKENLEHMFNGQLAESKVNTNKTEPMYQSADLKDTVDFMNRLNKIK